MLHVSQYFAIHQKVYYSYHDLPLVSCKYGRKCIPFQPLSSLYASAADDRYCVGLLSAAESSELLDQSSWTKSEEPEFISSLAASEYGPGHNSITVNEEGTAEVG